MKKIVMITGATSGIGKACAFSFAQKGDNLILTGRRDERLQELKSQLESLFDINVQTMNFDVRDRRDLNRAWDGLDADFKNIDVLINNAGLSLGLDPFYSGDVDDWENMIDTNVKGLLYVSRIVSNEMIKNKKGHIINIGSIAGKESYVNGNVYCASKAAVDSLSRSMRMDLLPHGIKVSAIHPGAVETEFSVVRFKGDVDRASSVYNGFQPLSPEDVAEVILFATGLPAHVNINDLLLMPTAQANSYLFDKKL